jgi:hypothetical protein
MLAVSGTSVSDKDASKAGVFKPFDAESWQAAGRHARSWNAMACHDRGPGGCGARAGRCSWIRGGRGSAGRGDRTLVRFRERPDERRRDLEADQGTEPDHARARSRGAGGRRLLALQRLASARADLSAWVYLQASPAAARKELAAFESEWKRMGSALAEDLGPPTAGRLEGVRPAAARALAEAALPQVRVFYEASLEYGRNTMPEYGLFYLGSAQAQRELVDLYRMLSAGPPLAAPPLRSLAGELAALEDELLALYRPPAAIDRHREFIGASAALKEARELEGLGLRYGALLRYLQAALRVAPLRPAAPAAGSAQLAERLRDLGARLAAAGVDHSLGRLFVEAAEAELTASTPAPAPANAPAIVADLLPRYLAALDPAKPAAARPEPQVTVTLVRWPYT